VIGLLKIQSGLDVLKFLRQSQAPCKVLGADVFKSWEIDIDSIEGLLKHTPIKAVVVRNDSGVLDEVENSLSILCVELLGSSRLDLL